jgi:serine/threonine protein kinase
VSAHLFSGGEVLLDRYKIDAFLDQGGMQEVFVSTDRRFGRKVVLKAPKNDSAEKRFARSAQMSARVTHANVAKTLDYIVVEERNYLIEEYVQGADLRRLLEDKFFYLDPHLAARLFHQLAKGVAASHHVGVFHRDLKPSNIIVGPDPNLTTVKITDFGIAKMTEHEMVEGVDMKDHSSVTGSQTVLGALPYMAPEMILTQKQATLPADIWALGAILYHLVSGTLPFGSGLAAIPTILQADLPSKPDLFIRKPQFSPLTTELWGIVQACLQKKATQRPNADDLVAMCSKLCYSDAKRLEGNIARYRHGTGNWGFLKVNGGSSVFFHLDSYYGDAPTLGQSVNFATFEGQPEPRAFPVLPLK